MLSELWHIKTRRRRMIETQSSWLLKSEVFAIQKLVWRNKRKTFKISTLLKPKEPKIMLLLNIGAIPVQPELLKKSLPQKTFTLKHFPKPQKNFLRFWKPFQKQTKPLPLKPFIKSERPRPTSS